MGQDRRLGRRVLGCVLAAAALVVFSLTGLMLWTALQGGTPDSDPEDIWPWALVYAVPGALLAIGALLALRGPAQRSSNGSDTAVHR